MDKDIQKLLSSKNWKDKTILLVEDNMVTIDYIETVLFVTKMKIISTIDGSQAANLLKENSDIDIILMDLQLVKSSGIKATKEIRTFNSSIPIIAETAHVLPSDKKNALEAGCSEFIPKPFTIETIINVLSKYLDA